MPPHRTILLLLGLTALIASAAGSPAMGAPAAGQPADAFVSAVAAVRPSVVGVGSYQFNDTPSVRYFGTGFVIDDGRTVATNAHVVEAVRQNQRMEQLRVFFPDSREIEGRPAVLVAEDRFHDVALLRFEGPAAPPLPLRRQAPEQGQTVGILGYPIGLRLGLVPAAHKGVVAAVVPAVLPLPRGAKLTPELAEAIRRPYDLYQLDLVVFPGNSGSPLFDLEGQVLGIVNKVLAGRTREHLLTNPSGIAYAVPSRWIGELAVRAATQRQAGSAGAPGTRPAGE